MILLIIILIYASLCLFMAIGFVRCTQTIAKPFTDDICFSVVISARNECKTIEDCIYSIVEQNYPKQNFEVIIVDDQSNDETAKLAMKLLTKYCIDHKIVINTTHLGKKKSLIKAIDIAKYNYIISRDADTITATKNWLNSISTFIKQTKKEFIICPVSIKHQNGILSALQETEALVLSVFTIATTHFKIPFLCSGANLVFSKQLFEVTNKYTSHLSIESGDDVFFLQEVKKIASEKIGYLKNTDALVYTFPETSFKKLLIQKIRWSGKVFKLKSFANWFIAFVIALSNITILYLIFQLIFMGLISKIALFFVILKLLIDILLVFLTSDFVKVKCSWEIVCLCAFIYPFYASLVVFSTILIKPKWKIS